MKNNETNYCLPLVSSADKGSHLKTETGGVSEILFTGI
jgi:hypothetical protein